MHHSQRGLGSKRNFADTDSGINFYLGLHVAIKVRVSEEPIQFFIFLACITKLDLIISLDTSSSFSNVYIEGILEFTKGLIRTLNVGSDRTRIGVQTFGNTPSLDISVDEFGVNSAVIDALTVRPTRGATNIVSALRQLQEVMMTSSRPDARKVIVIITDGRTGKIEDTIQQAAVLKNNHVTILPISVAVKDYNDLKEVESLSSSPSSANFINATDIKALKTNFYQYIDVILPAICNSE